MDSIFFGNTDTLTLHIRITKKCNADCSYCSSFETVTSKLMSIDDLKTSFEFSKEKIEKINLGGKRHMLTVQYIGGELLTVNSEYLLTFSNTVKEYLSPLFLNFRHGAQSNLIGSTHKINQLKEIFGSNIGTSYDNFTEQRTIKKDSEKYKKIFLKNVSHLKKEFAKSIDGVVVIDQKMKNFIFDEINLANKEKRNITLRPVFYGGSEISKLTLDELNTIYLSLFDSWFMKQNIIIEPFFSYTQKRIYNLSNNSEQLKNFSGCPSQHNCASVSLNLDPDGSLYTCQDLSDSKQLKFGNAIKKEWNSDLFLKIKDRSNKLKSDCYSCDYFKECQGGCMKEAFEQSNDIYGKTEYCFIWKNLFKKIDDSIEQYGLEKVQFWLNKINYIKNQE